MRALRALLGVTLAAAAVALGPTIAIPPPVDAAPIYPVPDTDGFYAPTPDLGAHANGDVLRSRTFGSASFPGATIWQLAYRSANSAGAPIVGVTTLLLPLGGGGNRPLISYQPYINSLGLQCAPSHTLFDGGLPEAPAINALLARGWAVAVPDHLGPTSAYGAARLGGQLVLDGIRAVQRFGPAGLGSSPVGMTGYSGGGMATGWAAALAPSYAPELRLVGASMGGVPVDIGRLAADLGGRPNPLFGLGFAAALGLEREYPSRIDISDSLTPQGVALRGRIANACADEIIASGANLSYQQVAAGSPSDAGATAVFDANSLARYPATPRIPIYQWHGSADQVPLGLAQNLAGRYCAAGVPVLFDVIPGADHGAATLPGAMRAFSWMGDRFGGVPAPSNC